MGNLYKCAGPTMGLLQQFFFKKRQMPHKCPGGCARLELTEPLFSARYWKEFCVSKWVGLDNTNGLKHYENSLKQLALTVDGLILRRACDREDFASEIWRGWGAYFREGFFWGGDGGLVSEFYGIHLCRGKLKITAGFINNCYISTLKLLTSIFDFI